MLTQRPHLTTLRPSPTTVSYKVSTASLRKTLSSQLIHALLFLLRILLGLTTFLTLLLSVFAAPFDVLNPLSDYVLQYPFSHIGALSFISLFLVFRRFHTGKTKAPYLTTP